MAIEEMAELPRLGPLYRGAVVDAIQDPTSLRDVLMYNPATNQWRSSWPQRNFLFS